MAADPQPLRLTAEVKDLPAIRAYLRAAALQAGLDEDAVYDVLLAASEAAANILVHGYCGAPGWLEVEPRQEDQFFVVALRDKAPQFDPTQTPSPDLEAPLERRRLGGMGVHLMRAYLDRIIYRPLPEGGNELTLVKYATPTDNI